jgi:asparagine N-glycosylation enzyme membrane subunit Stt3
MIEVIITPIIGCLIVFFIARNVIDRETFTKLRFLSVTGLLLMVGCSLLVSIKSGG